MTTLPTDIPKLDALVRAEAERRTQDIVGALHVHRGMLSDHTEGALVEAVADLLRDLSRPESRDWAVRALAELVDLADDASRASTAPGWGRFVCGEHSEGEDGTFVQCDLAIWSLCLGDRHDPTMTTFASCGEDTYDERCVVPGIDAVTDPAEALALSLAAVCRDA